MNPLDLTLAILGVLAGVIFGYSQIIVPFVQGAEVGVEGVRAVMRVERLAEAGDVCVTDPVRRRIHNKIGAPIPIVVVDFVNETGEPELDALASR